jgi:hypothetical protein
VGEYFFEVEHLRSVPLLTVHVGRLAFQTKCDSEQGKLDESSFTPTPPPLVCSIPQQSLCFFAEFAVTQLFAPLPQTSAHRERHAV